MRLEVTVGEPCFDCLSLNSLEDLQRTFSGLKGVNVRSILPDWKQ